MKKFIKRPDTINAMLYTGKNKTQLKKQFEIVEVGELLSVVTPLNGVKPIKPDQYVIIENGTIRIEDKADFEAKFKEVK